MTTMTVAVERPPLPPFTLESAQQRVRTAHAEMHRLDAGHFAVEDNLDFIASRMIDFYDMQVAGS